MRHDAEIDVAIVGTGFSGLGMAIELEREGKRSYTVFEQADRIGGTWRDNHYPGCACDVPSHLYSFSFAPNPGWSRMFAPHHEIQAYLERCADDFGVREHIQFDAAVTRAEFDEDARVWTLWIRGQRPVTARYLVLGTGPLSQPAYPDVEGLDEFRGPAFHSARWDHDVDLTGKRVAVVGTGASAIQIIPQLAPDVKQLYVVQRTPPWVLPKPDRDVTVAEQRLFSHVPAAQRAVRWWQYWTMELRTLGFTVDPRVMQLAARMGKRYLRKQIPDPKLRATLTPDYLPGCKRILIANDYYPALARDNVTVIPHGLERVSANTITTADGQTREVDAIVFGTGFRVTSVLGRFPVIGRGGVDMNDVWADKMTAYLGTTMAGFPNMFVLLGPNTGLGHNSMVFMIEAQVHYAMQCMRRAERAGARTIEVREQEEVAFNDKLQPRLARAVWSSGCNSWYLDAKGDNVSAWPGSTLEFWLRTRRVVAAHYELDAQPRTNAVPTAVRAKVA